MNFLKRHLMSIILFVVAMVLLSLSFISRILLTLSMLTLCAMAVVECIMSRMRYNALEEESERGDGYFDARRYDYDEDIYLVDEGRKKSLIKSKIDKFNAMTPFMIWIFISAGFALMAIYSIFKPW